MQEVIGRLEEMREAARLGGGIKRIDAQHTKGKLTRTRAHRAAA